MREPQRSPRQRSLRQGGARRSERRGFDAPEEPRGPSVVLRLLLAVAALAAGLSAGACIGLALPDESVAPADPPPNAWIRSRLVPVRIDAAEGLVRVEVELAPGRSIELWRDGAGVRRGLGGERESWLEIEPETGGAGLRLLGRLYPGSLLIEPRPAGGLRITNHAPLEDYVTGVVAAELSLWNANTAEIAAQAIAARSYASATLDAASLSSRQPYLHDTERDQVYRGRFEPDDAGRRRGLEHKLTSAVESTAGLYLAMRGLVEQARFHASCGGATAHSSDVFGGASRSMRSVTCEPCLEAVDAARRTAAAVSLAADSDAAGPADLTWEYTAPAEALSELARVHSIGTRLLELRPVSTDSGRWLSVELTGDQGYDRITINELREALGFGQLKSGRILRTWPATGERVLNGMYFEGTGAGHGVGLCQFGARGYGERGYDAQAILAHYFPGASLVRR